MAGRGRNGEQAASVQRGKSSGKKTGLILLRPPLYRGKMADLKPDRNTRRFLNERKSHLLALKSLCLAIIVKKIFLPFEWKRNWTSFVRPPISWYDKSNSDDEPKVEAFIVSNLVEQQIREYRNSWFDWKTNYLSEKLRILYGNFVEFLEDDNMQPANCLTSW